MTMDCRVYKNPSMELCEQMAVLSPANPFMTPAYMEARRALGGELYIVSLEERGEMRGACPAFLRRGRLARALEIMSLPLLPEPDAFWKELQAWCRREHVSHLDINTFGSEHESIPLLHGEQDRRQRVEYVLDLGEDGLLKRMSSNHARNVKRGRKANVQVHRYTDADACRAHVRLMVASMTRRRERGEQVPTSMAHQLAEVTALAGRGAGELFQAVLDGRVVSSILVLQSERAGYYHSAGTSADGMTCGASHMLLHDIAMALRGESKWQFNLGGVSEPESGLDQFKRGFGARRIELEAVRCSTATRLMRWLGAGVSMMRHVAGAGAA